MELSGSPSQSPVLPKRKRGSESSKSADSEPSLIRTRLGRYRITGELGQGGMGAVYEAQDTLLKRQVAIKLLPKVLSTNKEALARFLREAQVAARLNHPNVVAIYDIGRADGVYYIVMELVSGGNAQQMLRSRGPFHWTEATSILIDVCQGAAAAHQAGMIHRDIKPSNILRSADGIVKLSDFGLAKSAGVVGTTITAQDEIVGTPHYMSPEQSRCSPLDQRTDVYSLGATYFALVTGRPPFVADHSMQVLMAHCGSTVPDPRDIVADVPEKCAAIIKKAMAKDRSNRYANVGELLAELEQVLALQTTRSDSDAGESHPKNVWRSADQATNPLSLADVYRGEQSASRNGHRVQRWLARFSFIGLIVLCSLIVALAVAWNRRPKDDSPPAVAVNETSTVASELDQALRAREVAAMKRVSEKVQRLMKSAEGQDARVRDSLRRAQIQLEKAQAFRERITDKGLVLGLDGHVASLQFSPDDKLVVVGQGTGAAAVVVFDSRTGEKLHALWPNRGNIKVSVQAVSVSHDNSIIAAACADNRIRLWHLDKGKETGLQLNGAVQSAKAVAFSPIVRNLVAGLEPFGEGKGKLYLKIWNIDTNREPFAFKVEHAATVTAVDFCAGGHQVATGGNDKRIVMWNAETGRIWRELRTGISIRALACAPQGRFLAVAGETETGSVLQFWDYAAERQIAVKPSPHGPCTCIAFSRDGKLLATGSGSQILIWDAETQTTLATLSGHGLAVTALAFSRDGTILASGSNDQTLRFWDVTRCISSPERSR